MLSLGKQGVGTTEPRKALECNSAVRNDRSGAVLKQSGFGLFRQDSSQNSRFCKFLPIPASSARPGVTSSQAGERLTQGCRIEVGRGRREVSARGKAPASLQSKLSGLPARRLLSIVGLAR